MSTVNTSDWFVRPDPSRPPLALIAGPTASGKSDCAVALGQALEARGQRAVVINADSAQVYADLEVLSARPTPEEMGGIEHRLFGTWDGARPCSAADWAAAARGEVDAVHAQGGVPILVGGTGLYIRTLLDGIAPVPPIDEAIRAQVRALPVAEAYAALLQEDPPRAEKLGANDQARIARALEVVRSTGRTLADWQAQVEGGIGDRVQVQAAILLPERAALYARCDARFDRMIARGAVAEVARLRERRLDPDLPVMRAIGVPELVEYLGGSMSLEVARDRGAQATRNYAKRQYTWLRHQPPPHWPRISYEDFRPTSVQEIFLRSYGLT
ncbi:tRNA dimethylallyltransferase [Novosphingobium chloroacetimidivorans]|uniref:tRNA dimethylallyltransferase n=1 Tax=Novosphingobium chloroacetimidivorans TaxID=1428314 RepID=A0A7W7KCS7_9SPHN|nr:tRNA (adenosine(37)-N6)-dimethylallyltransferase MiaA [Novosphingobium chloroacetimidivorans]MBB4860472.1 tRNA dimethylallyltransferase [Novosphingobium chloroacetimidivorans]